MEPRRSTRTRSEPAWKQDYITHYLEAQLPRGKDAAAYTTSTDRELGITIFPTDLESDGKKSKWGRFVDFLNPRTKSGTGM